jgi:cysteinyl-tRNA synthetase
MSFAHWGAQRPRTGGRSPRAQARAAGPHMTLNLYNTLTRRLEPVEPAPGRATTLYTCGPTVYNYAHIGNLKTFIVYDFLKRTLRYFGHEVRHVMNLTDIEDKIIAAAVAAGKPIREYTEPYAEAFLEDLRAVGCEPAERSPRATEFIPQQIALIERLMEKGFAYERDGSAYFRIEKFPDYGKLARIDLDGIKEGARIDTDEYDKDSPRDFVLWKAARPEEEKVGAAWDSPWGRGRPGWHLECSVMAHDLLGQPIDIHAGGVDLIFPHHTNELAQSEAAYPDEVPFVKHWFHAEHLMVDGGKMSKSLGNVYTRKDLSSDEIVTGRDLAAKKIDPQALRYFFTAAHYRKPLNFTFEALGASSAGLDRLRTFQQRLRELVPAEAAAEDFPQLLALRKDYRAALSDDLNAPEALARLFEFVSLANKEFDSGNWSGAQAGAILKFLRDDFSAVFGVSLEMAVAEIPAAVQSLFEQRQAARQAKDFKRADELRGQIDAAGFLIEDSKAGARLKRK